MMHEPPGPHSRTPARAALAELKRSLEAAWPPAWWLAAHSTLLLAQGLLGLLLASQTGRFAAALAAPAVTVTESPASWAPTDSLIATIIVLATLSAALGALGEHQVLRRSSAMRSRVLGALLQAPMRFHAEREASAWQSDLEQATVQIARFTVSSVPRAPAAVVTAIAALALLASMSPPLALAVSATVLTLLPGAWLLVRKLRPLAACAQQAHVRALSTAGDLLANIGALKSARAEAWASERFEASARRALQLALARLRQASLIAPALYSAALVATVLVVVTASRGALGPLLDTAETVALIGFALVLARQVATLGSVYTSWNLAAPAAAKLLEALATPPETGPQSGLRERPLQAGAPAADAAACAPNAASVQLSGVSFAYPSGPPVLRAADLRLRPGECVALCGPNGAGKSTLAKLLLRLYDPDEGSIRLDGVDLSAMTPVRVRAAIGWAPQNAQILAATIADNVLLGRRAEGLGAALALSDCDTFIARLAQGVNSVLGAGQVVLSGGQQQRLGVARAVLEQPPVLILDEAMSMLPPADELEVMARIRDTFAPTILCITHRPHVIEFADRTVLLDEAHFHPCGRHAP